MIQNDANTAPDQLFFYPRGGQVEHHSSLQTANLPAVVHIPGFHHFVTVSPQVEDVAGYSLADVYSSSTGYRIPAGSRVTGILANQDKGYEKQYPYWAHDEDVADLKLETAYTPPEDGEVIVQIDKADLAREDYRKPLFANQGIRVLPVSEALPSDAKNNHGQNLHYKLLGFIADSKLVTWTKPLNHTTLTVEWSVAQALAKNKFEQGLLNIRLGELSLPGVLSTHPDSETYLKWFNQKHGTNFMPDGYGKLGDDLAETTDAQGDRFLSLLKQM